MSPCQIKMVMKFTNERKKNKETYRVVCNIQDKMSIALNIRTLSRTLIQKRIVLTGNILPIAI